MIDRDIRKARTLPAAFYRDLHPFERFRESLFRDAWHYLRLDMDAWNSARAIPTVILPDYLDEPVLLTCDQAGVVRCMSNVCTHRGNLLVSESSNAPLIRCRYHGRCFGLDGSCRSQSGFEDVSDFPASGDHLQHLDLQSLGVIHFARLHRHAPFDHVFDLIRKRMPWFRFEHLRYDTQRSRDYQVNAHWALYVDNYLEGYHVPFVHPGLNKALDPSGYTYELFPGASLQLGRARPEETAVFDIPQNAADAGERIFAYYWWVFPNLMLNVYPWGVSVNSVEPVTLSLTRVRFCTYVFDGYSGPDFAAIHQTELEDEAIVEQVQKGISSSFYKEGRYAPQHESAVHHFHMLLSEYLAAIQNDA